ncbi:MAG: LysM peptidoglycan-binding domain-containing protein, partial [Prevotella sp.]|nr:LysM peptidoglycan-binding domain-containing protein [Prevotella sp.]
MLLLTLCFSVGSMAQVNKWQDIYKVKKKDTLFGISKKYGITLPELMDANPEMKLQGYELKKGDTIFIPFARQNVEQKQKDVQQAKARKSTDPVRIGVMLPLHNV